MAHVLNGHSSIKEHVVTARGSQRAPKLGPPSPLMTYVQQGVTAYVLPVQAFSSPLGSRLSAILFLINPL